MNGKDTACFSRASDEWIRNGPIRHRTEKALPYGRNKWTFRFRGRFIVNPTGCFVIIGKKDSDGYSHLSYENKPVPAHRLSWILLNGEIPKDLCVCHTCDNPGCINPAHLFLGTNQENTADRNSKNRQMKGERSPFCKLTEANVREMRVLYFNNQLPIRTIAANYGVCFATAREAIQGITWGWLK